MKRLLLLLLALPVMAMGQTSEPQTKEELRLIEKIYYDRGVYIASDEEREKLKDLVFDMRADSTLKVHIIGFGDRWGGKEVNDRFSHVRAMYIADWMRSCRVPREQIAFVGEGIDTLAINDAEARRVEVSKVVTVAIPYTPEPEPEPSVAEPKEPEVVAEPEPEPEVEVATTPEAEVAQEPTPETQSIWSNLSLRSNLLYFAYGLINVGAEYKADDSDFGYLLNAGYSPFGGDGWKHSMGGWFVSPEVRYYIPANDHWFVGAQLLGGGYNVKIGKRDGYQGGVIGGGVTGGYKITLTERFDMDFNLGLGYGSYKYDSYYHENGVNIYNKKDVKRGALLPQAGVNLIWKIK